MNNSKNQNLETVIFYIKKINAQNQKLLIFIIKSVMHSTKRFKRDHDQEQNVVEMESEGKISIYFKF